MGTLPRARALFRATRKGSELLSRACALQPSDRSKAKPLMVAMDTCNTRFGRGSVVPARAGLMVKRTWSAKFEMLTRRRMTQITKPPTERA
ncbi:MAG: DUF4113 domain-containing protein [Methylobacterium sp.]|uniref:DUF4113 domain-containing protein n=1 Tax=Methylobacterium sp. TaxID=409 RepID=UPI003456DBB6|nr:DUF4113 domain-containing protein [Methylobacterium sp.]